MFKIWKFKRFSCERNSQGKGRKVEGRNFRIKLLYYINVPYALPMSNADIFILMYMNIFHIL